MNSWNFTMTKEALPEALPDFHQRFEAEAEAEAQKSFSGSFRWKRFRKFSRFRALVSNPISLRFIPKAFE
jgi:hypothetical protein